jgi:integrase
MSALAPTLEAFLADRLMIQRGASPNTIASYRDTFRLLLRFAAEQTAKRPSDLDFSDLDARLIGAFLEHLEMVRHNSVRTRNNRLAAIHSLFGYAALRHPEHAATIQRVLAIPVKLFTRDLVTYLDDAEVDALLGACDPGTWTGATRPGAAPRRRRGGPAHLRAGGPHLRGCDPRHRSEPSRGGKGPQGTQSPPRPGNRGRDTSVARRTGRRPDWSAVPDHYRPAHEP